MKTYKSSDLTQKRAEVFREAETNGVIIQQCNTNGYVRCEFILKTKDQWADDNYIPLGFTGKGDL